MLLKSSVPEKRKFTTSETILLVVVAILIGLCMGKMLNKANVTTKTIIGDENLHELVDNYQYIINNYYDEIDKNKLVDSAINGMMQGLDDPYSVYFDETQTENFSISLEGSYEGIGIQVVKDEKTQNILVVSVFKDSPASSAGLKAGDQILEIDGNQTKNYSVEEFSKFVKENNKQSFEIKIIRDGEKKKLKIERNVVTLNSVDSKIYEENNKKIGYIYIGIFANNTYFQFKDLLDELEKQNINSLIIDVRGNTGGHLTAVSSILDIFLTEEQKLYGFDQNGKITYTYGTGVNKKNYEIVLLANEVSASASEVLVAGLVENLDSKFFGKKTYGKGTVQELVTLSDGTKYKLTTKKWLTPDGNWINETMGIIPDEEIELDEKYYETLSEKDDSQLLHAIKYLSKK